MKSQSESLALQIYRSFRNGLSAEQLAAALGIPVERIRIRLQAAAAYWQRQAEDGRVPEAA